MKAFADHTSIYSNELSMKAGDQLGIAGNKKNGRSVGTLYSRPVLNKRGFSLAQAGGRSAFCQLPHISRSALRRKCVYDILNHKYFYVFYHWLHFLSHTDAKIHCISNQHIRALMV